MKIYELSQIGEFHINHNEDAKAIIEIGDNKLLIAVMDGCSMGRESHFASTLIAKLLRKIGKEISYRAFVEKLELTIGEYLKEVMRLLFLEMSKIQQLLLLDTEELLSTIILGVLDTNVRAAKLITVGDGLICVDGQIYEYEQDNQPDYLGYHLTEDFESWLEAQTQRLSVENITDLSISTDGIFTFKNFDGKEYDSITEAEIIDYLLVGNTWADQAQMLSKKAVDIERMFGLKASDDLTVIRVVFGFEKKTRNLKTICLTNIGYMCGC